MLGTRGPRHGPSAELDLEHLLAVQAWVNCAIANHASRAGEAKPQVVRSRRRNADSGAGTPGTARPLARPPTPHPDFDPAVNAVDAVNAINAKRSLRRPARAARVGHNGRPVMRELDNAMDVAVLSHSLALDANERPFDAAPGPPARQSCVRGRVAARRPLVRAHRVRARKGPHAMNGEEDARIDAAEVSRRIA